MIIRYHQKRKAEFPFVSDELINVNFTGYIILKGLLPVGKHCQIDLAAIAGKTQCGLNYIIL